MYKMVLATMAVFMASGAEAVTLLNGSFELGAPTGGERLRLNPGSTDLGGWNIRARGITVADASIWQASNGNRSIRLATADRGGRVWQRIDGFSVGQRYRLTFDLAGDPYDPGVRPNDKRVVVSASGGDPQLYSFTLTEASTPVAVGWQTYFYEWVASATYQNIVLQGSSKNEFGTLLDNVRLSVVPEPANWALMLLGFGAVGAARRRRRIVVAA